MLKFIPEIKTKEDPHRNQYDLEIKNGKFKIYFTEKYASIQLLGDIAVGFFFVFASLNNIFGGPSIISNSAYLIGSLSLTVRPILKIIRRTWVYNEKKQNEQEKADYRQTYATTEEYNRVKDQAIHVNGEFSEDVQQAFLDRGELKDDGGMQVVRKGAHFESHTIGGNIKPDPKNELSSSEEFVESKEGSTQKASHSEGQINVDHNDKGREEQEATSDRSPDPKEGQEQNDQESDEDDTGSDRGFFHHDASDDDDSSNEDEQSLSLDPDDRDEEEDNASKKSKE
ncbi:MULTISPECIES: YrhK family protein [Allobacillus]|uniref:YrhK domain-containing protein n=1 Tax=Allobacillus salarius TaxID=1955272 RepID=A0A556PQW4_9BACI|nr:YrhK family protein [Allobacillus salarius]TSJ66776.1 hypothetical protein FPQ13_03530 [Allobacillus salarius]